MASKTNVKIAVYVRGGVVQDVKADREGVEVTIFDVDDLEAMGVDSKEIDKRWDEIVEKCHWDTNEG